VKDQVNANQLAFFKASGRVAGAVKASVQPTATRQTARSIRSRSSLPCRPRRWRMARRYQDDSGRAVMVVGDISAASLLVGVPLWHSPDRPEREYCDLRWHLQAHGESESA